MCFCYLKSIVSKIIDVFVTFSLHYTVYVLQEYVFTLLVSV